MSLDPSAWTIATAAEALSSRDLSSTALTEACLDRIARTNPRLNSFLSVAGERARAEALAADERLDRQAGRSRLEGIPLALKDLFLAGGTKTTCGSRILETFDSPYDSEVTRRLREAGAVLLGKTNMDEFAMGSSNESSAYGPCRNPWSPDHVPGGSSGGSAVAVAARQCLGAIGTDTGGSIRLPASFCGVVGMKPTYGRVSRYGMVAYASSLDQAGPFAGTVRDAALLHDVIAGHDARDSTSASEPTLPTADSLDRGIEGLRLGVPREYFVPGMSPAVEQAVRETIDALVALGAEAVEVTLPHTRYAVAAYYLIATAEASSNLARYDGVRYGLRSERASGLQDTYEESREEGFGAEVKRRIMLGTYALSAGYYDAYYAKAQKVRTCVRRDFDEAFDSCDVIVAPVAATTAFRIGERLDDPLAMYLSDILTISLNLSGLPGLSVPCGRDPQGLPIGLQILGPAFAEERILRAASAVESCRGVLGPAPFGDAAEPGE